MPSNTVQSCVAKFLRNKHRDEFLALNPWMDLPTAAIVFFRRHTARKTSYASYRDIPSSTSDYLPAYLAVSNLSWWQIPVSQKQCAGIRAETWARYAALIAELSDQYQDVP
jgi:hypothetical protein